MRNVCRAFGIALFFTLCLSTVLPQQVEIVLAQNRGSFQSDIYGGYREQEFLHRLDGGRPQRGVVIESNGGHVAAAGLSEI